jgi:hypothetical protein
MYDEQPTLPGLESPDAGAGASGTLVDAARASIAARRAAGAVQPWHEMICATVIDLASEVPRAKGIAKAQLYAQMLAAEAKLPEPVIEEAPEIVEFELARIGQYLAQLERAADPAAIPDETQPAQVQ